MLECERETGRNGGVVTGREAAGKMESFGCSSQGSDYFIVYYNNTLTVIFFTYLVIVLYFNSIFSYSYCNFSILYLCS